VKPTLGEMLTGLQIQSERLKNSGNASELMEKFCSVMCVTGLNRCNTGDDDDDDDGGGGGGGGGG
jgi:hypothetical protein